MVLLRHISVALSAAVAALGSALFVALNYFYRKRIWLPNAEYCTIQEEEEDQGKRQVLVLGLDGAGKSSMLQRLTPGGVKRSCCRPTRGFNFMSISAPACQLNFLEMDSSDRSRFHLAKSELHHLLKGQPQLPVVILCNKQDKPNAVSVSELHEALSLGSVVDRKLFILATQLGSDGALKNSCQGLDSFQDLLLEII
nr:ADP-ribosylation factor-like 10 isoform X2 [Nerophis lumbriciformis]